MPKSQYTEKAEKTHECSCLHDVAGYVQLLFVSSMSLNSGLCLSSEGGTYRIAVNLEVD